MKMVLFCGGLGMRIRDAQNLPKPVVHSGYRPVLWHVMKYCAHFGHKDFILCLGHRANVIKDYFLNYNECASNDFVLSGGGKSLELLNSEWLLWTHGKVQRTVTVRLESTTGRASSYASPALCGLPAADMRIEPQGQFATVRLPPRSVYTVDVPAGEALRVEELQ